MTNTADRPVAPAQMLDRDKAEEYAEWFRTLSDATRVQILAWIAQQPTGTSVKDLTAVFPQSQSTISHHLSALANTCFVTVTRTGTQATYRVNPACADEMPDAVSILTGSCCSDANAAPAACCSTSSEEALTEPDLREVVQERYAAIAREAAQGCCSPGQLTPTGVFGASLYGADDTEGATAEAVSMSLGCGIPATHADLQPGERVLDLGSGAGADVMIAARQVGPTGSVVGVDMTPEMIDLARTQASEAGLTNVRFELGFLEELPLGDASIDVIISNCVINLTSDKRAALAEAYRVLAPGGRLAISDVVLVGELDDATKADVAQWTGCIAGALPADEYRQILKSLGFGSVSVTPTHSVHEFAQSATIRAVKPVVG